jgi:predicted metal-dependent phosphoesterase TrpH
VLRHRATVARAGGHRKHGGEAGAPQAIPSGALHAEPPTFDLQSHSLHSDGELSPSGVVETAARAGVELLSLTDHDTVDGVAEARVAARSAGLRLVSGVEISAIDVTGQDLHILGYRIDVTNGTLLDRLEQSRRDRAARAQAMVDAIRALGFKLDEDELRAREAAGKSVGRPHIAAAVVTHPANASRLAAESCTDPSAFLEAYLIGGRPAFRPRRAPSVADAIQWIHDAGGVVVWAHPFFDLTVPAEILATIDRFATEGLDGVECFYATFTREQTELLADHCAERGLLSTGSADFHGPRHRQFSRFRAFSTFGHEAVLGPIEG